MIFFKSLYLMLYLVLYLELQMAPSGQPGILALLQQSKDRLRGEQEDRLKGEQEVVEAKRRKVERKEQGQSEHMQVKVENQPEDAQLAFSSPIFS